MYHFRKYLPLLMFFLLLCNCKKEYRLAFVASSAPHHLAWSASSLNGLYLAVAEYEKKHPEVRIKLVDIDMEKSDAVLYNKKLASCFGIIGPISCIFPPELQLVVDKLQIPLLSPFYSSDQKKDFYFYLNNGFEEQLQETAAMVSQSLSVPEAPVWILSQDTYHQFIDEQRERILAEFKNAGCQECLIFSSPEKTADSSFQYLDELISKNIQPEAVFLIGMSRNVAYQAQYLRQKFPQVHFFCTDIALTQSLIEFGGAAVEGMQAAGTYGNPHNEAMFPLIDQYRSRFGRSFTPHAQKSYLAAHFLLEAANVAGFYNKKEICRYLLQIQDPFSRQSFFSPDGRKKEPVVRIIIKNGEFYRQ